MKELHDDEEVWEGAGEQRWGIENEKIKGKWEKLEQSEEN